MKEVKVMEDRDNVPEKHSPGPWKAEEWIIGQVPEDGEIGQGEPGRTEMVLHNEANQLGRLVWSDLDDAPWDIGKPEQIANARLIAAAPELLEALRAVCDAGHDFFGWDGNPAEATGPMTASIIAARAAIAKATT